MLIDLWNRIKPAAPDTGWETYFEPGETLLWSGAPRPGINGYPGLIALSVFGLPFLIGGVAMLAMGLGFVFLGNGWGMRGLGLFLALFSLTFVGAGFGMVFGTWIKSANMHRFVRYAVTDKQAYIATSWWHHVVAAHPIQPDAPIYLVEGHFHHLRFHSIREPDIDGVLQVRPTVFENIADGPQVYALLRQLQKQHG